MIKMTLNSGWYNDRDPLYTASCFTNFIFLSITEIFATHIEISSGLLLNSEECGCPHDSFRGANSRAHFCQFKS